MLPKIKKNIFQVKSENKKNSFNIKKFLISILFAGTTMVSTTQASTTHNDLNEIFNAQKISTFTLSHSERIGETSYHYSHSSHSSHSSHRSHYSSRY
jgi:hypothetical protein